MSDRTGRKRGPIAVRLLDVDAGILSMSGCPGYTSVMVFFRHAGCIIGRRILPLVGGTVSRNALTAALGEVNGQAAGLRTGSAYIRPSLSSVSPPVTIAVCTRDRASMLGGCLESLLAVQYDGPLELLVIDNCPSDDSTRELVLQFPSVRYAVCRKPGLDRARNMAISLARGEIVAFTDDDVRVDPSWVKNMVPNFADPLVAVVSGITLPAELETDAQVEFELGTSFIRGFVRREFTIVNSNPLHVSGMGAGANMGIRRSVTGEIGRFDECLDAGTPTESGGDHEFFFRALTGGFRIVYDPSVVVRHYHKRTEREATRTLYGYGVGVFAWWTKVLFAKREFSLIALAPLLLLQYHVKNVAEAFAGRNTGLSLRHSWAQLRGALVGPFAYVRSSLNPEHWDNPG